MSNKPLIFLIAGEASGDQLGADLMASLKERQEVQFMGVGGDAMAAQGLQSLFPMEDLSIIGLFGILRNLRSLRGRLNETVKTIQKVKPDIVVTIDAPEFSFRVLKKLTGMQKRPRLIHYGAPTVWAWRPGRAKKISLFLDHLLCLYAFEPPYFERVGLPATFVGHPLGRKSVPQEKRESELLCLLPGSRQSEIEMLLPIFKETVELIRKEVPHLKIVIPTLPHLKELVETKTQTWPFKVRLVVGDKARDKALQKSTAALAASGTISLQLSAARLPFVVAYKIGKISGWLARFLITTPWACMVNILLAYQKFGTDFVLTPQTKKLIPNPWIPEFIQEECRAEKLAPAVIDLLRDNKSRQDQLKAMGEAMSLLKAQPDIAAKTVLNEIS